MRRTIAVVGVLTVGIVGCSRSALRESEPAADAASPVPEHRVQGCGACDDGDPCTIDACGADLVCTHRSVAVDLDGDGHGAILPGTRAGEASACGDDCDDQNAAIFPGQAEMCDGIDNDCNGFVDEGFDYVAPAPAAARRISSSALFEAEPSGIASDGRSFLAYYEGGAVDSLHTYSTELSVDGAIIAGESRVSTPAANAHGGTIHGRQVVWNGNRFGLTWNDTRDGNYEVYFAALDQDRQKLSPGDVRLSMTPGLSFNPTIAWTGKEFVVAWEDEVPASTRVGVVARLVRGDGVIAGPGVPIIAGSVETPFVAVGKTSIAVVGHQPGTDAIYVAGVGFALESKWEPVQVNGAVRGMSPRIAYDGTQYVIVWYDPGAGSGAIWATTLDESGAVTAVPRKVSDGNAHARYPALFPLGNRTLLVFSDDRDANAGYEIYSQMLSPDLVPIGAPSRLTSAVGDSIFPMATVRGNGDIGILFRDDRDAAQEVWFTSMKCVSSPR